MSVTLGTIRTRDDAFLNRVKRTYRLSSEQFGISRLSEWRGIFARQKSVHDALLDSSNDPLAAIFSDPASTDLFYGVDNLFKEFCERPDAAVHSGEGELQDLRRLGHATGLMEEDPERILLYLDADLGQRVDFPNPFRGEIGLATSRGIASYRAIQALYQTHRIKRLVPKDNARILEIGPGMGRTALYSFWTGLRDYTTLDLPMGIVAQACFLGTALGPDRIWMVGDAASAEGKIRLLPANVLNQLTGNFDLVFNADSLVEMSPFQIVAYLSFIRKRARIFFSINRENKMVKVKHFARVCLPRRTRLRSPYCMRPGYFEEVFSRAAN